LGDKGPDVKDLQINLNEILGKGSVTLSGVYDDETAEAVEKAKAKAGLGNTSGGAPDAKLLKEIAEAAEPRTMVQIGSKKAYVTQAQYNELMSRASAAAVKAVRPFMNMAEDVKSLWEDHEKVRSGNPIGAFLVEKGTGANFPDRATVDKAIAIAREIEAEARTLSLDHKTLSARTAPIRQAYADLDQYIEETQLGGPKVAEYLTDLMNGCVVTLKVLTAVTTGGASWGVQVGAAAGMGAYENLVKEIDTASKVTNADVGGAIGNILKGATIEAAVGLIMKNKVAGIGNYLDDVTEAAVKKCGSSLLDAYARKAANGGAQKLIEDGIKALPEIKDLSTELTPEKLLKVGVEKMLTGMAMGALGGLAEKYGGGALAKYFTTKELSGLTGKALNKGAEEGVKKAIEEIGPGVVKTFFEALKPKEGISESQVEKDLRKAILAHPKIAKAAKEAAKGLR
jgi:peptidoglycan hydrolase-like protein with peptidoglycan-binding domain